MQDMADYPYSSYREYLSPKAEQLTDTAFINRETCYYIYERRL
jgi:hypothetical protein